MQFMEVTGAEHAEAVSLLEVMRYINLREAFASSSNEDRCATCIPSTQAADHNLDNAIALFFAKNDGPSKAPTSHLDALAGSVFWSQDTR